MNFRKQAVDNKKQWYTIIFEQYYFLDENASVSSKRVGKKMLHVERSLNTSLGQKHCGWHIVTKFKTQIPNKRDITKAAQVLHDSRSHRIFNNKQCYFKKMPFHSDQN